MKKSPKPLYQKNTKKLDFLLEYLFRKSFLRNLAFGTLIFPLDFSEFSFKIFSKFIKFKTGLVNF